MNMVCSFEPLKRNTPKTTPLREKQIREIFVFESRDRCTPNTPWREIQSMMNHLFGPMERYTAKTARLLEKESLMIDVVGPLEKYIAESASLREEKVFH